MSGGAGPAGAKGIGPDAGPGDVPVSVAVVARDEEDRLPRTLDSVRWAAETVVVVDARTGDRTARVARDRGARVRVREWEGYARQKARALEACRCPWVLLLDADEVVSSGLAREIADLLPRGGEGATEGGGGPAGGPSGRGAPSPAEAGWEIPFHTRYLGRWLGRRGWHRERHLRLVRRGRASVTGGRVHEGLEVEGPVGRLSSPILHYSYRDPGHHAEKIAAYARLKAESLHERGRTATLGEAVLRAWAGVVQGCLLKGRFLDGLPGLVWELMGGYYDLLTYVHLRELARTEEPAETAGRPGGADGAGGEGR